MSLISKKVSGKKYWFHEKYYTKEEALKEALRIKDKAKKDGRKVRTYIEEVEEYGSLTELFIPTRRFYLWINGD